MKLFTKSALAVLAAGMTLGAQALEITPATLQQWTGDQNNQSQINTAIAPIIGSAGQLYKQNVGGSEEGSLAGSYETTFSNTSNDPQDALIHYVGGPIVGGTAWLLVKDGNQSPAWYLFKLTDWDGMEDLVLKGFWPANGAISHVTLYGEEEPGRSVPDAGSTLALLGVCITTLGYARRRLS